MRTRMYEIKDMSMDERMKMKSKNIPLLKVILPLFNILILALYLIDFDSVSRILLIFVYLLFTFTENYRV